MTPAAAVILNYERPALTLRCLGDCLNQAGADLSLVVVDNGSAGDSAARISAAYPAATLLCLERNRGYAAGVNAGLRHALAGGAGYILLLNNDTRLPPDLLATLLAAAREHRALVCAPVICYQERPDTIWSAGALRQPLTNDLRRQRRGRPYRPGPPYWVDYATTCALLVDARALRQVGLFDERFFMYYEDLDWCWRLRARGLPILVVPTARLWHQVAASSGGPDSPGERYHMALSSVLFFRKHTRRWRWLAVAPVRLLSALRTSLRLARRRRWPALRAHWRGLWHGLRRRTGSPWQHNHAAAR